jgi:type I restriction enzyme S subunit
MAVAVGRRWETLALGNLAEFRNGINYNKDNFGRGIKVINVKDFQDYSIASFENLDEVNLSGVIKEKDLLKAGDIIFVRSNGNRELIGRSLFIKEIRESVTHSAFTIKLRFTSNQVIPRFYAYLFRSSLMRQTFSAHGNGTNISNLNQGILSNLEVPLPPLPTQRKIAAILSAYDDLIENNTRRIEILEEMARSIFREWFVNFRFPGHEQVQMVDSELGLIPEGWKLKTLAEFGQVITGKTPSKKIPENFGSYMPFIKTPDMHNNMFCIKVGEYLSEIGVASQRNKTIPPNSLCVSCIGTAGIVAITSVPSQTNQQINSIILQDELNREFLYFALLGLKETINQYGANGATIINLNKGKFESLRVTSPSKNLLFNFHKATASNFEMIRTLQLKNLNLRQTRDLLLPRLISGEIDVENLDINTGQIAA